MITTINEFNKTAEDLFHKINQELIKMSQFLKTNNINYIDIINAEYNIEGAIIIITNNLEIMCTYDLKFYVSHKVNGKYINFPDTTDFNVILNNLNTVLKKIINKYV